MKDYGELLRHHGEPPVAVRRVETIEEVLREADVSGTGGGGRQEGGRGKQGWRRGRRRSVRSAQCRRHAPGSHPTPAAPLAPGLRAQVVSLHCLLDASTKHLINKARLAMMKPDAILINAARGPIVDEAALVDHLRANPEFRCAR